MDEFTQELKAIACNVLLDNPGISFEDWSEILFDQFPAEVVDALGSDEDKIKQTLRQWWIHEINDGRRPESAPVYKATK